MRRALFLTIVLAGHFIGNAQTYLAVPSSSKIQFKIKNLGINVGGSFSGFNSTIQFDPANLAAASFQAQVDVSTINTGIDMRDDHLRQEDYFNVKNYPYLKLVSTRITGSTKQGTWYFFGKLTIKETTLDISFPFTATPVSGGYQFKGEFTINRKDFGVGGSSYTMADKVNVSLDVSTTIKN